MGTLKKDAPKCIGKHILLEYVLFSDTDGSSAWAPFVHHHEICVAFNISKLATKWRRKLGSHKEITGLGKTLLGLRV